MLTILKLLYLLLFSFANPFSLAVWIAAIIAWFIPWDYLGLWITSIVAAWTIVLFPLNRPYVDVRLDFSKLIIYSTNLTLFIGMGGITLIKLLNGHHKHRERSAFNK